MWFYILNKPENEDSKISKTVDASMCYTIQNNKSNTRSLNFDTTQTYFDWSTTQQGYVLASFFYGYVCTQVLGGMLADKYSPCKLFGWGLSGLIVMTLLTPLVAGIEVGEYKIVGIFVLRFIMGMSSGNAICRNFEIFFEELSV